MIARFARLIAVAVCLVLPLAWAAQARADTSATVSVTGQVVSNSLSITLSSSTFAFGQIDATGDLYDPATSPAQPVAVNPGNPVGTPAGLAWFAKAPITLTLTHTMALAINSCLTAQTNVIDSSGSHLFMPFIFQMDSSVVHFVLGSYGVPACTAFPSYLMSVGETTTTVDLYPTYLVKPGDGASTFSATIELSISPL
jgi:hypothetical protein